MKKLMIAACAMAIGAVAHAAAVSWGGAYMTTPGVDTVVPMQFALVRAAAEISAPTEIEAWVAKGDSFGGGTIVDTYTTNDEEAGNWEFAATYNAGNADVNGYYAILCLNKDGDKVSYRDLGQVTGTGATSPDTDLTINPGWDAGDYINDNGYTIAVAPEPTSGLLLLLGVAGLALRRRRA